ncbi:MAG: 50S ribosomal protein L7/L12 [Erysipelotrichaceae bacterium]|nr:50S ribosomal protein L7/L12 [Erysipelotrichaceae bacterium]
MAKLSHDDILAYLEEASILELNDLVKAIEEKFGVTAAAPVAVAAAPAEAAAEGPSSVSVILAGFGEAKTAVIKVVKEITGLGLVEAKGLVDKCPSPIKENISVEEAEDIKKKLLDAGASVDIK